MTRPTRLHWYLVGAVSSHDLSGGIINSHLRRRANNIDERRTQLNAVKRGQIAGFVTALGAIAVTVTGVTVTGNAIWVTAICVHFAAIVGAAVAIGRPVTPAADASNTEAR